MDPAAERTSAATDASGGPSATEQEQERERERMLVRAAQQGDGGAFEALYRRHHAAVVRRLSHLVGPGAGMQDLVQDTFLRAYQGLGRYRGDAPFAHWILRIATNAARSHYRRLERSAWRLWDRSDKELGPPMPPTGDAGETYPQLQAVHHALGRLSRRLREAVVLYELEGLSLNELAEQLEVPLHTAASRVRRGRKRLRAHLEELGFRPAICSAALVPKREVIVR